MIGIKFKREGGDIMKRDIVKETEEDMVNYLNEFLPDSSELWLKSITNIQIKNDSVEIEGCLTDGSRKGSKARVKKIETKGKIVIDYDGMVETWILKSKWTVKRGKVDYTVDWYNKGEIEVSWKEGKEIKRLRLLAYWNEVRVITRERFSETVMGDILGILSELWRERI